MSVPLTRFMYPLVVLALLLVSLSPVLSIHAGASTIWRPRPGASLQLQLDCDRSTGCHDAIDMRVPAQVYEIDAFDNSAAQVARLHRMGRRVICYIDAGSWESFRPDARRFPRSVLGRVYSGYPDERWLDIRRIDLLAPIMRARLDLCRHKGFDGVEPDNVDGYGNRTGFHSTARDQLRFNRCLAHEAHIRGLAAGLKNDPEQVPSLVDSFQWALTEDCARDGWCGQEEPFIRAGKPVFAAEYIEHTSRHAFVTRDCAQARRLHIVTLVKRLKLDAWRIGCAPTRLH